MQGITKPYICRIIANTTHTDRHKIMSIDKILADNQNLRESESRFRALFEATPVGVLINNAQTGMIIQVNSAFCNMLGYTSEELVGRHRLNISHYEDEDFRAQQVKRLLSGEIKSFVAEKSFYHKSGEIVYAEVTRSTVQINGVDYLLGIAQNITERRKAQQELEEKENLQRAILAALPDLTFRVNKEGIIVGFYNSLDNKELVATPDIFLGKTLQELNPSFSTLRLMIGLRQSLSTQSTIAIPYQLNRETKMMYYEARISPLSSEEVIISIRNITALKEAQIELAKRVEELNIKSTEMSRYIQSNLELENFAYIASHDLREPLRSLMGFAQLLERRYKDIFDDDAREYLRYIMTAAKNMNNLIEDTLLFSKVNSSTYSPEKVSMPDLIGEVMLNLQQQIAKSDIRIYIGYVPRTLHGSRSMLIQLFQNLLSNAIKFSKKDYDNHEPRIVMMAEETPQQWIFTIADNGIGIPSEYFQKIFLLFRRLNKQSHEGTGIGLAVCKKIVELHGGKITVNSEVNVGTSFQFTIPK